MQVKAHLPPDAAAVRSAIADPERIDAVRRTCLLDTPPDESFDRLTRLAAKLIGAPATFLSLVDQSRDFYKSSFGFGEPLKTKRQLEGTTFCHYALVSDGPLVLDDVTQLPVFRDVPTVQSLGVRAYAGIPLVTESGQVLGSFCAIDFKPRSWTESDVEVLSELAHSAMREIELRKAVQDSSSANQRLDEQIVALHKSEERYHAVMPSTDHAQAMQVAERLRQAIEAASVPLPQGLPVRFTVSMGITTLSNTLSNLDMLLDQADQALYMAKKNGRNQVCSFVTAV